MIKYEEIKPNIEIPLNKEELNKLLDFKIHQILSNRWVSSNNPLIHELEKFSSQIEDESVKQRAKNVIQELLNHLKWGKPTLDKIEDFELVLKLVSHGWEFEGAPSESILQSFRAKDHYSKWKQHHAGIIECLFNSLLILLNRPYSEFNISDIQDPELIDKLVSPEFFDRVNITEQEFLSAEIFRAARKHFPIEQLLEKLPRLSLECFLRDFPIEKKNLPFVEMLITQAKGPFSIDKFGALAKSADYGLWPEFLNRYFPTKADDLLKTHAVTIESEKARRQFRDWLSQVSLKQEWYYGTPRPTPAYPGFQPQDLKPLFQENQDDLCKEIKAKFSKLCFIDKIKLLTDLLHIEFEDKDKQQSVHQFIFDLFSNYLWIDRSDIISEDNQINLQPLSNFFSIISLFNNSCINKQAKDALRSNALDQIVKILFDLFYDRTPNHQLFIELFEKVKNYLSAEDKDLFIKKVENYLLASLTGNHKDVALNFIKEHFPKEKTIELLKSKIREFQVNVTDRFSPVVNFEVNFHDFTFVLGALIESVAEPMVDSAGEPAKEKKANDEIYDLVKAKFDEIKNNPRAKQEFSEIVLFYLYQKVDNETLKPYIDLFRLSLSSFMIEHVTSGFGSFPSESVFYYFWNKSAAHLDGDKILSFLLDYPQLAVYVDCDFHSVSEDRLIHSYIKTKNLVPNPYSKPLAFGLNPYSKPNWVEYKSLAFKVANEIIEKICKEGCIDEYLNKKLHKFKERLKDVIDEAQSKHQSGKNCIVKLVLDLHYNQRCAPQQKNEIIGYLLGLFTDLKYGWNNNLPGLQEQIYAFIQLVFAFRGLVRDNSAKDDPIISFFLQDFTSGLGNLLKFFSFKPDTFSWENKVAVAAAIADLIPESAVSYVEQLLSLSVKDKQFLFNPSVLMLNLFFNSTFNTKLKAKVHQMFSPFRQALLQMIEENEHIKDALCYRELLHFLQAQQVNVQHLLPQVDYQPSKDPSPNPQKDMGNKEAAFDNSTYTPPILPNSPQAAPKNEEYERNGPSPVQPASQALQQPEEYALAKFPVAYSQPAPPIADNPIFHLPLPSAPPIDEDMIESETSKIQTPEKSIAAPIQNPSACPSALFYVEPPRPLASEPSELVRRSQSPAPFEDKMISEKEPAQEQSKPETNFDLNLPEVPKDPINYNSLFPVIPSAEPRKKQEKERSESGPTLSQ